MNFFRRVKSFLLSWPVGCFPRTTRRRNEHTAGLWCAPTRQRQRPWAENLSRSSTRRPTRTRSCCNSRCRLVSSSRVCSSPSCARYAVDARARHPGSFDRARIAPLSELPHVWLFPHEWMCCSLRQSRSKNSHRTFKESN